ncbi:hypothetical protein JCM16303_003067 [Sporobolomyces ruberrimus]
MAFSDVLSFRETAQLAREYLEVAFHLILYLRQVYPEGLFRQVKKYDSPVFQSRAPALTEYLGRVLECIEEEMLKGTVKRVVLVIKEGGITETPLERFVFDFEWMIPTSQIPQGGSDFTPAAKGLARGDVEDLFRACLRKLNASTAYLKKLSSTTETTFAVVLEMKEDATKPESKAARRGDHPAEWYPAEVRVSSERLDQEGDEEGYESTVSPVHGIRLGMLSMDIRIEETGEKFRIDESSSSAEGHTPAWAKVDRKGKGRAL